MNQSLENFNLFISYSIKDKELAYNLSKGLLENGINVKFDENIIYSNESNEETLIRRINMADCILVLLTQNSIKSNHVMNDLRLAQSLVTDTKYPKLLIPVIYGEINLPSIIAETQVIFWRDDYEETLNKILRAVYKFIESDFTPNFIKQGKAYRQEEHLINFSKKNNYWLLKLNPNTWEINNLQIGETTYFNTHYNGEKRPEFQLFSKIKKGDQVLGFATGDFQSIICTMEVIEPVGPNNAYGEGFKMVVKKLHRPFIPLNNFQNFILEILPKLLSNHRPPELLLKLSEKTFKDIIDSTGKGDVDYENDYQPYFLTEGNHKTTEDKLDFENDINSFATVIALRNVSPPLAIGLFGNWGSGKSFFMEKLAIKIESLAGLNEPEYVNHVVQVKFNSWHYSDANLWASLISQIFESLNDYAKEMKYGEEAIQAIYKNLSFTNIQLEETKKQIIENETQSTILNEKQQDIEKKIEAKKDTLEIWKTKDLLRIIFTDPNIQNDFNYIKSQFEEEKLIDNIDQIDEKLSSIETSIERGIKSINLLKENSKGKWIWIWIIAGVFALISYLVLGPYKIFVKEFIDGGYVVTGLFLAWVTNFYQKVSPYLTKVNNFHERLKSLKQTIEKEKIKVKLKEHSEIEHLKNELSTLNTKRLELNSEQQIIEEKRERLKNEILEIGSGKVLANFLANKSIDEGYLKQLGTISWIRKDFAKLNDLFQKQKSAQSEEKALKTEVQIDRIILYIDDLDRCNEGVVVKVLEAIHLLLAFPLFVVVVGVDPRWLNNALSDKYKNLFGSNNELGTNHNNEDINNIDKDNSINKLSRGATSYDYLEKIFQIPFALKPINKAGREELVKYLIRDEMESKIFPSENGKSVLPVSPSMSFDIENAPAPNNSENKSRLPNDKIEEEKSKGNLKKAKKRLVFSDSELLFMQKVSSIFGQTPRAINRYVNIYRIIKAHGSLKVKGDFSKEDFMPIMFILAIIVGYSTVAKEFLSNISNANDSEIFKVFISKTVLDEKLKALIESIIIEIEDLPMENFKRNIELISRFSFRTLIKEG